MEQKIISDEDPAKKTLLNIGRTSRKLHSSEEKIRIVISGKGLPDPD